MVAGTVAGNVGMAAYRDMRVAYSWVRRKMDQRNQKYIEKERVKAGLVTLKKNMKKKKHRRLGSELE